MTDAVDRLSALYAGELAQSFYDEAVTELAHSLQAAELAIADGAPDEWVVAALLHDVGHLLAGDLQPIDAVLDVDAEHELVGAQLLSELGFGPEVVSGVGLHVAAKRYLCATERGYADSLSPSSVRSLAVQGGPMSDDEVAQFEARAHFEIAVQVRRWDDLAKVAGAERTTFADHRGLLAGLLPG